MKAIFLREFRAYFKTPIGYVALAILFFVSGFLFSAYNLWGGSSSLSGVYSFLLVGAVMLVILPVLTMRSFSEEKRQRTDQALLTAPIRLTSIVLGKFFAALLFFALGLCITFVYTLVIATQVTPDIMVILGNYLGMLLLAGTIIAAGIFFSALTESQIIAFLTTFAFSLFLMAIDMFSSLFSSSEWMLKVISFLSVYGRYTSFTQGLINYDNVFFFLSLQALFLFLTVHVFDRKRWA